MSESQQPPDLCVEISPDRLTARLVAKPQALSRSWTTAELRALCTAAGLLITPELEQKLPELEDAKKRPAKIDTFELCRGTAPVDAQPASFLYNHADGFVPKNTAIASLEPARAGSDGVDVAGGTVAHTPAPTNPPQLPALTRVENGTLFTAADCYLHSEAGKAQIDPISVIEKLETIDQQVTFDRTVLIRGNVHKGVPIQAKRSLIIDGSIDAAVIAAAHDFCVGGIFGRAMGRIIVGRNLRATFIKQANVIVHGALHVAEEVFDSDITCYGKILAPNADIRGGRVHAESGIDVRAVGNESLVRTTLEIGLDVTFEKLLESKKLAIVNGRRHIEQVRMHVKPLMANPKRLTGPQKEKATELLFQADELQGAIDGHLKELRTAMELMTRRAESALTVRATIYPGTTIRFQGVETTIRSAINGPCRIVAQGVGEKHPSIVVFMGTSATPQALESRTIAQNAFSEMKKLAA
jgi:uncharacterized protein (DUF342 family)